MEKIFHFSTDGLQRININLAWPQVEVSFGEREDIHILIAGDDGSVAQMKVEQKDEGLLIEQPQYGLFKSYRAGTWMQVMVEIPATFSRLVDINTVTGSCLLRAYRGEDLRVNTVSGKIILSDILSKRLRVGSISGSMTARNVRCEELRSKSVSGSFVYENLEAAEMRASSVSARQSYDLRKAFHSLDITSVSGNIDIMQPYDKVDAQIRAVASSAFYDGVELAEGAPRIHINIVSGNVKIKKTI